MMPRTHIAKDRLIPHGALNSLTDPAGNIWGRRPGLGDSVRNAVRQVVTPVSQLKRDHGKEIGHFRGRFATAEEALRSAPAAMRSTWDDEALVENGIPNFSSIHLFDWPVLFFMQGLADRGELHTVTDFGGHVGVKYSAYRQSMDFPEDLRWQVVEVPAVIEEAQRRVSADTAALRFFERPEDTSPCDVLLCSGSLQYAGTTAEELVNRISARPKVVILNKVPVSKGAGYFTVERYIKSLAYQIFGAHELEEQRNRLGYKLAARWAIHDRDIVVMHSRSLELVKMVGEVWTL